MDTNDISDCVAVKGVLDEQCMKLYSDWRESCDRYYDRAIEIIPERCNAIFDEYITKLSEMYSKNYNCEIKMTIEILKEINSKIYMETDTLEIYTKRAIRNLTFRAENIFSSWVNSSIITLCDECKKIINNKNSTLRDVGHFGAKLNEYETALKTLRTLTFDNLL